MVLMQDGVTPRWYNPSRLHREKNKRMKFQEVRSECNVPVWICIFERLEIVYHRKDRLERSSSLEVIGINKFLIFFTFMFFC